MFGGGEIWTLRSMEALQNRGHRVMLCCRPATEVGFRGMKAGFPVYELEFGGDFNPVSILRLALLMSKAKIDVVLANMDKELRQAGLAALLVRPRPIVIPRRGIDYPLKNRLRYRLAYNKLATRIIANSQATKRSLLKNAPWLNPDRIEVVYNGIDPEPFEQADGKALRKQWGIGDDTPVLGFVGQLDPRKGIGVLLTAFEEIHRCVPEARLVFVGEGPLREMIESEARVKHWQGYVTVAGFMDDVPAIMNAIDVLVLPSFWEGFGIVLIEAMAAKKPVITTNISSMPEIVVAGETGFLIEPGDSETLARHAIELLTRPALRRKMGEKGSKRVQQMFSHNIMINHLEAIFKQELAKRRQTH
ncbi:MAG: glycosyltransferase family 1 protein [Calditrichaeota bacterium]|nr:MAG: glycosyltransferase family 1 protein [Calditrichota bacterium]